MKDKQADNPSVKRFKAMHGSYAIALLEKDGDFVLYEDYVALQEDLAAKDAVIAALQSQLETARRDSIKECIDVMCLNCQYGDVPSKGFVLPSGDRTNENFYYHGAATDEAGRGVRFCDASRIRALAAQEPPK